MSEYQILTVFAAFAFAYSLIASRLEKTPLNGALVDVAVGMLFGPRPEASGICPPFMVTESSDGRACNCWHFASKAFLFVPSPSLITRYE